MNFNELILLIRNNSPQLQVVRFDKKLSKEDLIILCEALSSNNKITKVQFSYDWYGEPKLRVYANFIDTLAVKNKLAMQSPLIEAIADNFQRFFIEPLMYFTDIGKYLRHPFDYLIMATNRIGNRTYSVNIPSISATKEGLSVTRHEHYGISLVSKIFVVPFHYTASHIGKLIGFSIGLAISLILSPFSLAKSLYDYKGKNAELQERIEYKEKELDQKRRDFIASSFQSLSPAAVMLSVSDLLNKNAHLPEVVIETAIQHLQNYTENNPEYGAAMFFCGQLLYEHTENKEMALEHFKKAQQAGDSDAVIMINLLEQGKNLTVSERRKETANSEPVDSTSVDSYKPIYSGQYGDRAKNEPTKPQSQYTADVFVTLKLYCGTREE